MILASWNIRGLNDPLKQREVFDFLMLHKVDCCGILETHVKALQASSISKRSLSRFSLVINYHAHYNGRIWILWNPTVVSLTVLGSSGQFIHYEVVHLASQCMLNCTFIYAFNNASSRQDLWGDLRVISASISSPWACTGDFNVVLSSSERVGGVTYPPSVMKDFGDCLDFCKLSDHPATGCLYTWSNNQNLTLKWAKLDRILVNWLWFQKLSSSANFLNPGASDHSPALLRLHTGITKLNKPFRFLNCWSLSPLY
ncbi:uncharacterized protein LOC141620251 [Silene latifolia]|uniref:uncharacterized protein LOC141620251 n=1 Tax=Silene latifolia TaxID=37657 RepID=UPI003D77BF91